MASDGSMSARSTSRRTFLKSGLAAIAAAGLASCTERKAGDGEKRPARADGAAPAKHAFVRRTLGRTGIEIPIISMGGSAMDKAVYRAALDAGITHIDTDALYRHGRHERLVGEIIRERARESLIVVTKIQIPFDESTGRYKNWSSEEKLLEPLDASMKRLGVDYLDVLYLHSVETPAAATYGPVLETLQRIKKGGRARSIGIAVHGYEPDVMRAVVDCGAYDVIMVSYNFKQRHAAEIKEAIGRAAAAGLGIVAMKTQAGGFLDRERTQPINHRAAIKWVLSDTNVTTAIPGFETIEEMETLLSVMDDLSLTPGEQADLDEARRHAGLYCQQCGRCVPQCPHGVFVPAYMRAFMYAYGYRNPGKARETIVREGRIRSGGRDRPPCAACASCSVSCAMGFDVRDRIVDIARVRDVPEEFLRA